MQYPIFLYWTKNLISGSTDYHFMSLDNIPEGTVVRNDAGEPCEIVDLAIEFPKA